MLAALLASAALAGCRQGAVTVTLAPIETAAPPPQAQIAPTLPQDPAPPSPTPLASCVDGAEFLEDLTLPDGTEVLPGAALDKRWLILNRGSCAWGPEYRLVRLGESRIEGPRELALYPAVPGSQAVWQVAMMAPLEKGEYISRWQARAPDGTLFGDEVYVLIVVNPAPLTPTAIPTAVRP